ncbi:MAG: lipoprotein [Marinilabiliaceae bacterium]
MKKILFYTGLFLFLASCQTSQEKIPVHAWMGGPGEATDEEIAENFADIEERGIDALMYNGGHDPETYERVGQLARDAGLEFHAWIPTMVQSYSEKLDSSWYAVNGEGKSALTDPAYVSYYNFLCPNREGVYQFLEDLYTDVAKVEQIDGVHLDYIRFPDVILARGLWEKYNLVMDREYPEFDYCYCDSCVTDFKEQTGIDILDVEHPAEVEEWKQFRYDLITGIVNRLSEAVHDVGKEISAAVFPGPNSVAKKIVRQEWDKWNLDAFYPMNYNDFYLEDNEWVGDVTREGVDAIDGKGELYSGLFICLDPEAKSDEPDPENHGLTPEQLDDAIRESMENGATGVCLFTPGRMTEEHWEVFSKAIKVQ